MRGTIREGCGSREDGTKEGGRSVGGRRGDRVEWIWGKEGEREREEWMRIEEGLGRDLEETEDRR